ncbi:predicted protein [Aspergillus terreus NIH2624]|uniref:T6SS Phospholipase effector Tle1-like catalytic domain-containing protein n=1 Tax=Aspergillus terreus (strain NIH 2624 / FGSC A1156) TaxID=341663 RepID=Q0C895_ASPTN|nr:uncharacterized protein ATEG_10089 [Aspergillus terreus NIH2624]EAU29538.1 predicted protein [Aspergillus terreus NIH2624]
MKRLIVLCDGTWQDSTTASPDDHPTNVTRLSRALSPYAVTDTGLLIPQIVFYQPGVGTNLGDKLRGGLYGAGLSAHIRAAYGFLCHNWEEGDEIFLFGFSRGAYTARSIGGLVTSLGLLSKRGMDKFPDVYEQYYDHGPNQTSPVFDEGLLGELREKGDLRGIGNAIRIIGVWDTVGFHGAGITGEKIEFYNQRLSPRVQHAYHALSLDESRAPYQPTLWEVPRNSTQDLQQVWFSGVHADIGGGLGDSRLSDISLAWMIGRCAEDNKLAFVDGNGATDPEDYYLLDHRVPVQQGNTLAWATAAGPTETPSGFLEDALSFVSRLVSSALPFLGSGLRTPMSRISSEVSTNETIHCSIQNRNFSRWPCAPLTGGQSGGRWTLTKRAFEYGLEESVPNALELRFKGRMRRID